MDQIREFKELYVANLANDVHCNFLPEALMNTVSNYEAAYWLEGISYNFFIWVRRIFQHNIQFGYVSVYFGIVWQIV